MKLKKLFIQDAEYHRLINENEKTNYKTISKTNSNKNNGEVKSTQQCCCSKLLEHQQRKIDQQSKE